MGKGNADDIFESIRKSRALETGNLEHLEDMRLFVPNIDKDKVSDMTTNIIRKHLIDYTQQQCKLWDLPLTDNVATGFYWDRGARQWLNGHEPMFIVHGRKILLVPKGVVSYAKRYTPQQYHRYFVLNYL